MSESPSSTVAQYKWQIDAILCHAAPKAAEEEIAMTRNAKRLIVHLPGG
jgi:hypothetical protein